MTKEERRSRKGKRNSFVTRVEKQTWIQLERKRRMRRRRERERKDATGDCKKENSGDEREREWKTD